MQNKRLTSLILSGVIAFSIPLGVSNSNLYPNISISANAVTAKDYNPSAASSYARKYYNNYNSNYSNYNSIGGDCANFVSQCLHAGGMDMTSGWYWKSYNNHSASWTVCESMHDYFKNQGYTIIENPSAGQVLEGNPVLYSWNGSTWGHAAICVGNSNGTPVVAAHNNDYLGTGWKMGAKKVCTILITDSGKPDYKLYMRYHTNGGELGSGSTYYIKNNDGIIWDTEDGSQWGNVWTIETRSQYGLINPGTFKLYRDGYTFKGWCLSADGKGTLYDPDDTTVTAETFFPDIKYKSGEVTFYAIWEKNKVAFQYNVNGGVIADNSDYYADKNGLIHAKDDGRTNLNNWDIDTRSDYGLYNASTFNLTRDGCNFLGWSLSENSGTIYDQDDNTVLATTFFPDIKNKSGTVTFYAQWGGHEMSENEGAGQTIPDGDYWITNALSPRYLVDIPGDNYNTKDETNVQMWLWDDDNWGEYDVFTIKYLNNGFYSITQRSTNMAIDLYRSDLRHRTNIQMCEAKESKKNQQWSIKQIKDGYMIQSRANGLYFDVKTDNTDNSNLHTFEETGLKSQIFDFVLYHPQHQFGEWEVAQAPTQTSEGSLSRICPICGEEETQSIPAVPFDGNGTQDDPYRITSKQDLETMRDFINDTSYNLYYGHACYVQTTDIDLENESWIPIGLGYDDTSDGKLGLGDYNYLTRMFFGNYDGNNHIIKNLNVDGIGRNVGLFSYIRGEEAIISNLVVSGNVTTTNGYAIGGIVGEMQYGSKVNNCAFIGNVSANEDASYVGGIAGQIWASGDVTNCYHTGNITGAKCAGGISGRAAFGNWNSDGDETNVKNCYHANGIVRGSEYTGVSVGRCEFYEGIKNYVRINNCYGTSDSGANTAMNDATVDTTLLLRASEMKKAAVDLGTAYTDNTDSSLNNGYPVFTWQIRAVGDISQDGVVSVNDAVLMQKYLHSRETLKKDQYKNADINGDGKVNVYDLILLKRKLLQK